MVADRGGVSVGARVTSSRSSQCSHHPSRTSFPGPFLGGASFACSCPASHLAAESHRGNDARGGRGFQGEAGAGSGHAGAASQQWSCAHADTRTKRKDPLRFVKPSTADGSVPLLCPLRRTSALQGRALRPGLDYVESVREVEGKDDGALGVHAPTAEITRRGLQRSGSLTDGVQLEPHRHLGRPCPVWEHHIQRTLPRYTALQCDHRADPAPLARVSVGRRDGSRHPPRC